MYFMQKIQILLNAMTVINSPPITRFSLRRFFPGPKNSVKGGVPVLSKAGSENYWPVKTQQLPGQPL